MRDLRLPLKEGLQTWQPLHHHRQPGLDRRPATPHSIMLFRRRKSQIPAQYSAGPRMKVRNRVIWSDTLHESTTRISSPRRERWQTCQGHTNKKRHLILPMTASELQSSSSRKSWCQNPESAFRPRVGAEPKPNRWLPRTSATRVTYRANLQCFQRSLPEDRPVSRLCCLKNGRSSVRVLSTYNSSRALLSRVLVTKARWYM